MLKTKKKGIKSLALLLALILTLGFSPATNVEAKAAPRLNYKKVTLVQGKKKRLKVRNLRKGRKVKWYSTKKSVATVNKKGIVKAKKKGKAYIVAKVGKKKYRCKVIVKKKKSKKKSSKKSKKTTTKKPTGNVKKQLPGDNWYINFSGTAVGGKKTSVTVGTSLDLFKNLTAGSSNLSKTSNSVRATYYKWYSSNASVFKINRYGTGVAKAVGKSTVYCKYMTKSGKWKKTKTVSVEVSDGGNVKFSYSLSLEESPFKNAEYKVWDFYKQSKYDESLPKFNAITVTIQNNSSKSIRLDRVALNITVPQPTDIYFENPNFSNVIIPANSSITKIYYANYAYDFAGWEYTRNYIIDKKVFKSVSLYYSYNGSRLCAKSNNNSKYEITPCRYLTRKEWNDDDPYK